MTTYGTCFMCGKPVPDASGMVACRGGCYEKAFGIAPLMGGMSRREFLEKREKAAKKKKTPLTPAKPKPVQAKKPKPVAKAAPPKKVPIEDPETSLEVPICSRCDEKIYGEQEISCIECGSEFCRSCFQIKRALKMVGCDVDDEYACTDCWKRMPPSQRYCTDKGCKGCRNQMPSV